MYLFSEVSVGRERSDAGFCTQEIHLLDAGGLLALLMPHLGSAAMGHDSPSDTAEEHDITEDGHGQVKVLEKLGQDWLLFEIVSGVKELLLQVYMIADNSVLVKNHSSS